MLNPKKSHLVYNSIKDDGGVIEVLPQKPMASPAVSVVAKDVAKDTDKVVSSPDTAKVKDEDSDVPSSAFKESEKVSSSKNKANSALDYLTSISSPTISKDVMDALNKKFSASSAYKEAMDYTNALLDKLSSGKTSYTDQIKDMMNKIQNRDKFTYDVDSDPLFQQALASAMGSGKQAMQDTMGQASALTGGYASTYAQSAGNQAYNAYIEDAYNNLPEYYQMAMDAYNMEGQEMYNQLNMLNQADATEYGRNYDAWNANFTNAQNMYNQEYGAWQDSVNNAYNNANLQLKQQGMIYDQAFSNYNALQSNAESLYNQEYQKWQDSVNLAYDNYWKQKDNDYRYNALAQDQSQFNARYDANSDGVVDYRDQQTEAGVSTLTSRELNTVSLVYEQAGGGEKGYQAVTEYLEGIGKPEVDFMELDTRFAEIDAKMADDYANMPVWEKEWTITEDTKNKGFIWSGVDHDDVFSDGHESYTYDELKDMLDESDLSAREKKDFLDKLSKQSKK